MRTVVDILYFRLVYFPALESPLAVWGLAYLLGHWSGAGALILLLALLASFALSNGLLFRSGIAQKRDVFRFIERFPGARFERLPPERISGLFDADFLIPTPWRPRRLVEWVERERCRVYFVSRGTAPRIFPSPRAFVSPLSQDLYAFVRERNPGREAAETHFQLAHELGHGSAMLSVALKRNLLGLKCVILSLAWVVATSPRTGPLLAAALVELAFCLRLIRHEMRRLRDVQPLFEEMVADYLAVRHLSAEQARLLASRGKPPFGHDPGLSEGRHALREEAYRSTLSAIAEGRPFDVPQAYQDHVFKPPPALVAFTCLHLVLLAYFAWVSEVSAVQLLVVALPATLFYLAMALQDGALRVGLLRELERGEESAAGTGAAGGAASS